MELVEGMGDLVGLVQAYILRALEEAGPGMKVMLLDAETTPIVSLAFAQSALMRQEVFLFERVQEAPSQEDLRHLKCIAILRPDQVRRGPAPPPPGEPEAAGGGAGQPQIRRLPPPLHQPPPQGGPAPSLTTMVAVCS